jgi:hypothetical protein
MKNSNLVKDASGAPKHGIVAVHCFNNTRLTPEEHQQLIDGPIAAVSDDVEAVRRRVDPEVARPTSSGHD